jgi:hypothetical protein
LSAVDPDSGVVVPMFHPRRDVWGDHFALDDDGRIRGRTATGRATTWLLQVNSTERVEMRRLLRAAGRW